MACPAEAAVERTARVRRGPIPLGVGVMSRLAVSASLADREVMPGRSTTLSVEIRNLGSVVNRYRCRLHGLDPDWWTIDPAAIELFPEQFTGKRQSAQPPSVGRLTAVIHPPRSPAAAARPWRIGILVWSEHDPTERQAEEAEITFLPFSELAGEMRPSQLSGERESRAALTIRNQGNRTERLRMAARDPGDWFEYTFAPQRLTVEPGQEAVVDLHVRLRERPAQGAPPARPFTVEVGPEDAQKPALAFGGTFEIVDKGRAPAVTATAVSEQAGGARTGRGGHEAAGAVMQQPAMPARRGRSRLGCLVRLVVVVGIALGLILAAFALDPELGQRVSDWLRDAFPQLTLPGSGRVAVQAPGAIALPLIPASVWLAGLLAGGHP